MKIALVHDWLNGMRGGEKILEVLCELFPDAPIYTLFCDRTKLSKTLQEREIIPTILQKFPFVKKLYRHYLPFYTYAVERVDLSDYDVIVSISHCIAKGFKKREGALHICYCNTPMRYVWGFQDQYFGRGLKRKILDPVLNRMREWDLKSSDNVDFYIANSENIRDRIKRCYGRDSDSVIYPPVDTEFFTPGGGAPEDFFLAISALVPYKRIDIAVEAFNKSGLPLRIIGSGPEETRLRKIAKSNIVFLGWQDGDALRENYRRCRALVFPGEEDFGIVPLEAQACGRPVIAYGEGGVLETVVPHECGHAPDGALRGNNPTGIFFADQTAGSLAAAIKKFEGVEGHFNSSMIRENALRFSREICKVELKDFICGRVSSH